MSEGRGDGIWRDISSPREIPASDIWGHLGLLSDHNNSLKIIVRRNTFWRDAHENSRGKIWIVSCFRFAAGTRRAALRRIRKPSGIRCGLQYSRADRPWRSEH